MKIECRHGELSAEEQAVVSRGFDAHAAAQQAPLYHKENVVWVAHDTEERMIAALTASVLWDWMYLDELWVDDERRGDGLGRQLMQRAEKHAVASKLQGVWLWTQSWQAEQFYRKLGYAEFTRFEDFPQGHSRIGLRKSLATDCA